MIRETLQPLAPLRPALLLTLMAALALGCGAESDSGTDETDPEFLKGGSDGVDGTGGTAPGPGALLKAGDGPTGVDRIPTPKELPADFRYDVELGPDTDYIDGHPDFESADFDGIETIKIKPKPGKSVPFGVGRILVSRDGFMARRVVGRKVVGSTVELKTVPAELTEAFSKIDIEGEMQLVDLGDQGAQKVGMLAAPLKIVWLDIQSSKTKTKSWNFGTKLIDTNNVKLELNGGLDVSYTFYLKIYIATGADSIFRSWVRVEADSDMEAKLTAGASASTGEKEKSFASWQIAWSFGIVSGILDFDLVLNSKVEVGAEVTVTAGMGFDDLGFKVGAEWVQGDGWKKISEKSNATWHKDFSAKGKANIDIVLFPALEVAILIYGLVGPELAIGPEVTATFTAQASSTGNDICGELDVAVKAEANFVVDLLGLLEIAEKNFGTWTIHEWDNVVKKCWAF